MHEIIFYPVGNGESLLIKLENGKLIAFDYADLATENTDDRRMPLHENFKNDIGWYNRITPRRSIDVLAISHGDLDHVKCVPEHFWMRHASKYQSEDRIKIDELWVPAALLTEEGSEDDTRIVRQEARHRFLAKEGIRVFSRPQALVDWLSKKGLDIEDYKHLCCDAGTLVPNFSKLSDGVEFFVHSPFAERKKNGDILDRNKDCLVLQAVFSVYGVETRVIFTGDIPNQDGAFDAIINITRAHKNDDRLKWDVLDVPHHCSYLSLSPDKGSPKTQPTPEVEWFLNQGQDRSIMVCSSKIIPAETTDQPPHVETARTYQEYWEKFDGEWRVTMEHPSSTSAKAERTVLEISASKAKLLKRTAINAVAATPAVRVG